MVERKTAKVPRQKMPPLDPNALYELPDAAPYLNMGTSTLRRLLGNGVIPRRFTTALGGKISMTGQQILDAIANAQRADDSPKITDGRPYLHDRAPATGPAHRPRRKRAS